MSTFAAATFTGHHFLHPFAPPPLYQGTLAWEERAAAITVLAMGILLAIAGHSIFVGVAGVAIFYLLSGYFKARRIQQLPALSPPPPAVAPPPHPKGGSQPIVPPPATPSKLKPLEASRLKPLEPDSPPIGLELLRARLDEVEYVEKPLTNLRELFFKVRDETAKRVSAFFAFDPKRCFETPFQLCAAKLLDPSWIHDAARAYKPHLVNVELVKSPDSAGTFTKNQLLGRYDVLVTPCRMDFDAEWQPLKGHQTPFYVHHAGALNIGEKVRAEDFSDYSAKGELDETKYLADMGKIVAYILRAQKESGVEEAVWFPFGMGAFMRLLHRNDRSYEKPEKLWQLKQKLAQEIVRQFQASSLKIHFCLPVQLNKEAHSRNLTDFNETNQNYNAFVLALDETRPKNVSVYVNGDAAAVAQKLANNQDAYKVSLANAPNRHRIGNQWWKSGLLTAVAADENLSRRSSLLAVIELMLNGGPNTLRNANTLSEAVELLQQLDV